MHLQARDADYLSEGKHNTTIHSIQLCFLPGLSTGIQKEDLFSTHLKNTALGLI